MTATALPLAVGSRMQTRAYQAHACLCGRYRLLVDELP
jgi:hypothetical protein